MNMTDAEKVITGTLMIHASKGRAIARGPITGEYIWVDVPEDPLCPDIPYNAHISQLEFADQ